MTNNLNISWDDFFVLLSTFDKSDQTIYGVPKGGMLAAGFLKHAKVTHDPSKATMILDDIIDSGTTEERYSQLFPKIPFVSLIDKRINSDCGWVTFPWERDSAIPESIHDNITRQLQYIGEDPKREGLIETPNRVVRSWDELFAGYKQDPASVFKVFESDGYNQIVLLKGSDFYSVCEHHMLPFYGKCHVAYIPNGKVIGVSKLARLVDVFAKRMQIQERIGEQVTDALMQYLQPKAAACVIKACHLCMRIRGVSKQHSTMVTSSLRGVFLNESSARAELFSLIKGV
jgi:GTP cyclohydrolase I